MTDAPESRSVRLRSCVKRAVRPAAEPILARLYGRVDRRVDERMAGAGESVSGAEDLRILLDRLSEQHATLHDLSRRVAALEAGPASRAAPPEDGRTA